jgi:hypothetical protein
MSGTRPFTLFRAGSEPTRFAQGKLREKEIPPSPLGLIFTHIFGWTPGVWNSDRS